MSKKIRISSTIIKELKKDDFCPRKVKATRIDGLSSDGEISKPLMYGKYFETQCIGAGASGDKLEDLPRLKAGGKSTDHKRIDEQVELFKKLTIDHGVTIERVQHEILLPFNDRFDIGGTIDFTGPFIDDELGFQKNAIHDIKLTKTIYADYGDWSWHFPHNMDHTQPFLYITLWEEAYGETLPFYYWIFDYKVEPEHKFIRKKFDNLDRAEIKESIRSTIEKIEFYENADWFTKPSFENCKNCPLRDECPDRVGVRKIEVV